MQEKKRIIYEKKLEMNVEYMFSQTRRKLVIVGREQL